MLKSMVRSAVIALVLIVFGAAAWTDCLVKPGDRMVFFGDSITEQQMYTRYVMNYFSMRYPGAKIEFRNAGWVSDTAVGGNKRLQRDVLDLKPTVVSICYGMNDAGVTSYKQEIWDRYIGAMSDLVKTLKSKNIRVVLLTPGCVDESRASRLAGYNATLGQFAEQLTNFAAKERIPIFNIHTAMLDTLNAGRAADPNFIMTNDGVHPGGIGHVVMAYGLLKAMGCIDKASALTIDAASGQSACERCSVAGLKVGADSITFTRKDDALPIYFDDSIWQVMQYVPQVSEFDDYSFKVTGLKPGNWTLTVQGMEVGKYSSDDLAKGINLANAPGPWKTLGEEINKLSKRQENIYWNRWRQISLADLPTEVKREQDALLKKMDSVIGTIEAQRISKAATAGEWKWELKRTEQQ